LLSGNMKSSLHRLLSKNPNWPAVPLDGARVAAEKISALIDTPSPY
jgi:hypothetical protein